MSNLKLPAIVDQWIITLLDPNIPDHKKLNSYTQLKELQSSVNFAIDKFENPKKRA